MRRASATSGGGLLRMGSAYYGPSIDRRRIEVCPLPVLRDEWVRLQGSSGAQNVFLGWEFASTWWDHFKRGREGRAVVVRDVSGAPIAVVPLYVEERSHRFGRSRVLGNLGQGGEAGPALLDALVAPGREEEVCRAIALFLENDAGWEFAQLSDLEPDGAMARLARGVASVSSIELRAEPGREYDTIALDDDYDALVHRRGETFRKELKQIRRKIERDLRVRLRTVGDGLSVSSALGLLARLERESAVGRRSHGIVGWRLRGALENRGALAFHTQFAERMERRGELDMSVLFSQGSPIAAIYGTRRRETFVVHACAASPRVERWSPGPHLVSLLVERLCEAGVETIVFAAGKRGWCDGWADGTRSTVTLQLIRPEWRSRSSWIRSSLSAPSRSLARLLVGRDTFEEMVRTWSAVSGKERPARDAAR